MSLRAKRGNPGLPSKGLLRMMIWFHDSHSKSAIAKNEQPYVMIENQHCVCESSMELKRLRRFQPEVVARNDVVNGL